MTSVQSFNSNNFYFGLDNEIGIDYGNNKSLYNYGNHVFEFLEGNNGLMFAFGGQSAQQYAIGSCNNIFGIANQVNQAVIGNDNKLFAFGNYNSQWANGDNNFLYAKGNNNRQIAYNGNNTLVAEGNNNTQYTGNGNDNITTGGGYVSSGGGNDVINVVSGAGKTKIDAGEGDDTININFTNRNGKIEVNGGKGKDKVVITDNFNANSKIDLSFDANGKDTKMSIKVGDKVYLIGDDVEALSIKDKNGKILLNIDNMEEYKNQQAAKKLTQSATTTPSTATASGNALINASDGKVINTNISAQNGASTKLSIQQGKLMQSNASAQNYGVNGTSSTPSGNASVKIQQEYLF